MLAGQHTGNFLKPRRLVQFINISGGNVVCRLFFHFEMTVAACGHLRRMGNGQHLHRLRQPRQPFADRLCRRAADTGVHFVKNHGLTTARLRQINL